MADACDLIVMNDNFVAHTMRNDSMSHMRCDQFTCDVFHVREGCVCVCVTHVM